MRLVIKATLASQELQTNKLMQDRIVLATTVQGSHGWQGGKGGRGGKGGKHNTHVDKKPLRPEDITVIEVKGSESVRAA
jgi:hypothetical protein